MKILRDYWFSGLGPLIGIVAGVDEVTGKGKAYIGVGQGIDQEADAKYVAKTGAKLPLPILDEIRALLAPPGEKTTGKHAIQVNALQCGVLYGLILEANEAARKILKDVEKQLVALKLEAEEAAGVTKEILPGGMMRLTDKAGHVIVRDPLPYETEGN